VKNSVTPYSQKTASGLLPQLAHPGRGGRSNTRQAPYRVGLVPQLADPGRGGRATATCRSRPWRKAQHSPNSVSRRAAEYDVAANAFRPLSIFTDTSCSSATVAPDGTLVQTGGWNDGFRNARTMPPCGGTGDDKSCDWSEKQDALAANRWYATNQILHDGRAFIVGGRRQFNYEFYPKAGPSDTSVVQMSFLARTKDLEENNLYPFVHLNIDGNFFIFSNNRAVLLDYKSNRIVRTYPVLGDGDPRNYPSSGSLVLLPLKPNPIEAEVLVCGVAPVGSYNSTKGGAGTFVPALTTCGRIKITDAAPAWVIETMLSPRVMGDMILLPNGAEVAIINGAADGTAGWESAKTPAYAPVVYLPTTRRGTGSRSRPRRVSRGCTTPRWFSSATTTCWWAAATRTPTTTSATCSSPPTSAWKPSRRSTSMRPTTCSGRGSSNRPRPARRRAWPTGRR